MFEQFKLDEDTILVGHSCGAGFLLRYLSENKIKVDKVVLVAPFLDPSHEFETGDFFDFKIDDNLMSRVSGLSIFVSHDDDKYILDTVEIIKKSIKMADFVEFENKGHFTFGDMKSEKFPELLEIIIS